MKHATVGRAETTKWYRTGLGSAAIFGACVLTAFAQPQKQPVDYVSPNIGGIGHLLTATVPYVLRPHGMARLDPITTPGITDRYLADKIYGFPAGPALLMASVGKVSAEQEEFASDFDHDFEIATPYYYEVDLLSWGIRAELTATNEAAYYRFTFPASARASGAELGGRRKACGGRRECRRGQPEI